jgi:hypothetical protein
VLPFQRLNNNRRVAPLGQTNGFSGVSPIGQRR